MHVANTAHGLCEVLQGVVGLAEGHCLVVAIAGRVEGQPGLVVAGVQAAQVPDAAVGVRELAVGLAASHGRGAERILVVGQQAALLVALAEEELLVFEASTRIGLAAANVELLAGVVLPEVQAIEAAVLAAGRGGDAVGKPLLGQEAALLVANTQEELLVPETSARPVRAGAVPGDVEAAASHACLDGEPLVRGARAPLATGPRARADGVLAAGEEDALLVAKAGEELLVVLADIAVVEVLRGRQGRHAARARAGRAPGSAGRRASGSLRRPRQQRLPQVGGLL
mmetsp:Transcript_107193/g.334151  ORF Transcript_107193/g.334151 Transcript_107193/m.334151 type:complete len:284 (+) Transcript_107193:164-1015(+)